MQSFARGDLARTTRLECENGIRLVFQPDVVLLPGIYKNHCEEIANRTANRGIFASKGESARGFGNRFRTTRNFGKARQAARILPKAAGQAKSAPGATRHNPWAAGCARAAKYGGEAENASQFGHNC